MATDSSEQPSLSELVDRWASGDNAAAMAIWRRYESRIARHAEHKISPAFRGRFDPDDIAVMTLESVLMGIQTGKYAVNEGGTLWNLCAFKANRNIRREVEHHTQQKRDVYRESPAQPDELSPDVLPTEPSPEETNAVAAEVARIREILGPDDFQLYELLLAGHTSTQIAEKLDCGRWTVERRKKKLKAKIQDSKSSE